MRSLCLNFQVHQPYRLRTYRFFDIGDNHYYYDDYLNRTIIRRIAERSYIPANNMLLKLIKENGSNFKVSFSISGLALEQMEKFAPEALMGFKKLASTGCVEFLAETYSHSLASLRNEDEFYAQVDKHARKIESLFGKKPTSFRNTELIYSDEIGRMVANMGYKLMLGEGAKHILGWKSPNYMYCNSIDPKLHTLLRNFQLSDDLAFRFSNQNWSEWPLTAEKFTGWLNHLDPKQEVVNIFIDYPTFGEKHKAETGIFDFLQALPAILLKTTNFTFKTPSELYGKLQPVSAVQVPFPASWADEERDVTAWLGNELQQEAVGKLYELTPKVRKCNDPEIQTDWCYLQASDHFFYMSTKVYSDGEVHQSYNPFGSPYDAFINYMNVLSDFTVRLDDCLSATMDDAPVAGFVKEPLPKQQIKPKSKPDAKARKTTSKIVPGIKRK